MTIKSAAGGSKPITIGDYYFYMYQMISEQERLIRQKEALLTRQKKLQVQVDNLEQEIQLFDRKLMSKRESLRKQNIKSCWSERNR